MSVAASSKFTRVLLTQLPSGTEVPGKDTTEATTSALPRVHYHECIEDIERLV